MSSGCTIPLPWENNNNNTTPTTTVIVENNSGGSSSGGSNTVKATAQDCPNCGHYPGTRVLNAQHVDMGTMMEYLTVQTVESTLSMEHHGLTDIVQPVDIQHKK